MKKVKDNRGGARAGAGRAALDDKLQPITLYFRESFIESFGGRAALRSHILSTYKCKDIIIKKQA